MIDTTTESINPHRPILVIPKIISIKAEFESLGEWDIYLYSDFSRLILDDNNHLRQEVANQIHLYLNGSYNNFRIQLDFFSVPLMLGIFTVKKEICFYTSRANTELFLLHEVKMDLLQNNLDVENLLLLRSYVEKVVSLKVKKSPTVIDQVTNIYQLPNLLKESKELNLKSYIEKLLIEIKNYKPSWFERVSDYGLEMTAQFSLIRIHLLKFLAILPSLDYDHKGLEVKRILRESFTRLINDSQKAKYLKKKGQEKSIPRWMFVLINVMNEVARIFPAGPLAKLVRWSVKFMARRFIAGETIETATESIKELASTNRDVTLDQLGELVVSEKEADQYCEKVIQLIQGFSLHVKPGEKNGAGILKANVSIKVSALCSDFKPEAFEYTFKLVAPRLKKILKEAKKNNVFINIDAEHYSYRNIVFDIYAKILKTDEDLKTYTGTGIVLQAYLRDAAAHLEQIIELSKERNILMPIRIVKGAYWDAETVEADAHSFNAPEFINKDETDIHFRQLLEKILQSFPHVQLCLASHNFSDHCYAVALKEKYYPSVPPIEHQCLHMTYEALSTAMTKMGWVVRNYVPVGSLIVGMAYLVRRIMENSSQVGVLTIMRSHKKKINLTSPTELLNEKYKSQQLSLDKSIQSMTADFFNVTPLRTYLIDHRKEIENELLKFRDDFGKIYKNKFSVSGEKQKILSNSDPKIVVGEIYFASSEDVAPAVEKADSYYTQGIWPSLNWFYRSAVLVKAANLMLIRRTKIAALICYESGKSVNEALGDVDEAIDFLNYYAREEGRTFQLNPSRIERGVIGVISPWNFPLAIPCGMISSALVAGNSVVLKSAEQTPLVAQVLVDLLHESGVPESALIHLPGFGETVGDTLVKHERVASIVFTGSKSVGMSIIHHVSQKSIYNRLRKLTVPKSVIAEMGGKNAVIVTANAELDETVDGILYSAFGHSGQKCSAASRIIVDLEIKEKLLERLKHACIDLRVGVAFDMSSYMNPIISEEDKIRLQKAVKEASQEANNFNGKVILDRSQENLPGQCLGPTLIDLPANRAIKQESFAMKELFGPILHIIGFTNLDHALEIYNASNYALTGGVFSQSQDDIDYLTARMESGNIYVNRSITGARVAIEPFGGFKLSGTGPKAGSDIYLDKFHLNRINLPSMDEDFQETPADELGESYQFSLAKKSDLSSEIRLARVIKAIEYIIDDFESLYQGIYGDNKKILNRFRKWIALNFLDLQTKGRLNREIPGQISYNDYSMPIESVVVIAYEQRPHFSVLMQVLSAILMGTGVTILTRNQKSFEWWSNLLTIFVSSKISTSNIDVYFSSEDLVKKTLKKLDLSTIIVDGNLPRVERIIYAMYEFNENDETVKTVLTPFDAPNIQHFLGYLTQFVKVRSFAINTMRHGAPLTIEL